MADFNSEKNVLVWFDLPVADLNRAQAFYAAVLACEVHREKFDNTELGVIYHGEGNGGCLVIKPEEVSDKGSLNYLNVDGRLRNAVRMVADHGGKILKDVHSIGPHGFRAVILDSEGNRIALHSRTDA